MGSAEPDADGTRWGRGDGIVYAGAGDVGFVSPNPEESPGTNTFFCCGRTLPFQEGWFFITWWAQEGPWSLNLTWSPGTTLTPIPGASIEAYSYATMNRGVRAGVPAAAIAHLNDGVDLQANGGQLFGWVSYTRGDYFGLGELALTHEGVRHTLDLDQIPSPDDTCFCYEEGRWIFSTHENVRLDLNYTGHSRDVGFYATAIHLPTGTLPGTLWLEQILHPRNTI